MTLCFSDALFPHALRRGVVRQSPRGGQRGVPEPGPAREAGAVAVQPQPPREPGARDSQRGCTQCSRCDTRREPVCCSVVLVRWQTNHLRGLK